MKTFANSQRNASVAQRSSMPPSKASGAVRRSQAGQVLHRKESMERCPEAKSPEPDYRSLARQVHEGIDYIWGTDEEKIYRALGALDRDGGRICRLQAVYRNMYHSDLLADIHDDFSGEELAYALELLGQKQKDFKEQRIQAAPLTKSGYLADAHRLYEAAETWLGTDEEAIFAVLFPLAGTSAMSLLEKTYFDEFGHSVRYMIEDEMSGSEMDYALELLDKPVDKTADAEDEKLLEGVARESEISRLLQEAYRKVARPNMGLQVWWVRRAGGKPRWDQRYWVFEGEEDFLKQKLDDPKLTLKPGVTPFAAATALFDQQHQWGMDCGQFVEIARIYVLLKLSKSEEEFNERFSEGMELRSRAPKKYSLAYFTRGEDGDEPVDVWKTEPSGRIDLAGEQRMLEMAPVGSRIRWTAAWTRDVAKAAQDHRIPVEGKSWYFFQHENAIKLGSDLYGAPGLGKKSAEEIVDSMAGSTRDALGAVSLITSKGQRIVDLPYNPSDADIKEHIYVTEIEYFRWSS